MKLLFVCQRYGPEVAGGAEAYCRQMATILADRGHQVDALTSCATSYVDWANVYEPGTTELDGVTVHRLPVAGARQDRYFGPLNARVVWGRKPVPLYLQKEWMRQQGPFTPDIERWMLARASSYDVVVFVTYLYYTAWAGMRAAAGRAPILFHPTAHDEPPLALSLFDTMFRLPSAFCFLVEEEAALVRRRFHVTQPAAVVGVPSDLDVAGDPGVFRRLSGLGDRPYLLFLGRVDPAKGSQELYENFLRYKERNPGPLALAIVGDPITRVADHPDVVMAGFVPDEVRTSALAGAMALVQPSYFESFSIVLTEAWAQRRPALAQGYCEVLSGQAYRSGGAIPYKGFAQFEVAIEALLHDPVLRRDMGERGRTYVESRYSLSAVADRYERLLHLVA